MNKELREVLRKIFLYSLIPFVMIISFNITAGLGKQKKQPPKTQTVQKQTTKTVEVERKNDSRPSYVDYITQKEMKALNEALNIIDKNKIEDPQKITEVFLESMGYPKNIVEVKYFNPEGGRTNFANDTRMGTFNLSTGNLELNSILLNSNIQKGSMIAVLRHELDHFDKSAKICKAVGIDQYKTLHPSETFNENFWKSAMYYADTTDFDHKKFYNSILSQTDYYDPTSLYDTFTELTHGARSMLEVTAYAFSDYIEERYQIRNNKTSLKKLSEIFNELDWDIYYLSKQSKYLSRSRSAIFDYFYVQTMAKYNPEYKTAYQDAIVNGDVSYLANLYRMKSQELKTEKLDERKIEELGKIFYDMEVSMNKTLTNKEVNDILYLKYITLKYCAKNLAQEGEIARYAMILDNNVDDYLEYLKIYGTGNDKLELDLLTSKLQLANITVDKGNGKKIKLGEKGEIDKTISRIEKNPVLKKKEKESKLSKSKFFENYIKENALF